MTWGPKSERPKLDVYLDELRGQLFEDEHQHWLVLDAGIYDNESKSVHHERFVVPSYMIQHLIQFLPRFLDMYKNGR